MKDFSSWINVTWNESEIFNSLSTKSKEFFSTVSGESFFKDPQLSDSNECTCFGQHFGHFISAHININKFDQLVYDVKGKTDVLVITETKLDDSFPTMQFNIEGYYTFNLDWNEYTGRIYYTYEITFSLN